MINRYIMSRPCPFCSAVDNDLWFCESENFVAIYNIAPILPGHSMIIPKNHYSNVLDMDNDKLSEMMIFSREVINILTIAFKAESYNWTIQDGEPAGQTVDHVHMHIIPRTEGDLPDPGDWYPLLQKSTTDNIDSSLRAKFNNQEYQNIINHLKAIGKRKH